MPPISFRRCLACVVCLMVACGEPPETAQHDVKTVVAASLGDGQFRDRLKTLVGALDQEYLVRTLFSESACGCRESFITKDSDAKCGVDREAILFHVGHAFPRFLVGRCVNLGYKERISVKDMRLGDAEGGVRYALFASCQVLAHGKAARDGATMLADDYILPGSATDLNGNDGADSRNVMDKQRWGNSMGDKLRLICGGSSNLSVTNEGVEVFVGLRDKNLPIADAFILGFAAFPAYVPACIAHGDASPASSGLYDVEVVDETNTAMTHVHIEYPIRGVSFGWLLEQTPEVFFGTHGCLSCSGGGALMNDVKEPLNLSLAKPSCNEGPDGEVYAGWESLQSDDIALIADTLLNECGWRLLRFPLLKEVVKLRVDTYERSTGAKVGSIVKSQAARLVVGIAFSAENGGIVELPVVGGKMGVIVATEGDGGVAAFGWKPAADVRVIVPTQMDLRDEQEALTLAKASLPVDTRERYGSVWKTGWGYWARSDAAGHQTALVPMWIFYLADRSNEGSSPPALTVVPVIKKDNRVEVYW